MQGPSVVAECCKPMRRDVKNEKGQKLNAALYTLQSYGANGSGKQLSCYWPKTAEVKAQLIKWMTTSIPWSKDTYWEDQHTWQGFDTWLTMERTGPPPIAKLPDVDRSTGNATWGWPRFPVC